MMMGETSLEVFTSVFKVTEKKLKNLSFSTVWFDELTAVNKKKIHNSKKQREGRSRRKIFMKTK